MDPEEALRLLRLWVSQLEEDPTADQREATAAERFAALDGWLTRGGFPPHGWKHPDATAHVSTYVYLLWGPNDVDPAYYGSWEAARRAGLRVAVASGKTIRTTAAHEDRWSGEWNPRQGGHLYDAEGKQTGVRVLREQVIR